MGLSPRITQHVVVIVVASVLTVMPVIMRKFGDYDYSKKTMHVANRGASAAGSMGSVKESFLIKALLWQAHFQPGSSFVQLPEPTSQTPTLPASKLSVTAINDHVE